MYITASPFVCVLFLTPRYQCHIIPSCLLPFLIFKLVVPQYLCTRIIHFSLLCWLILAVASSALQYYMYSLLFLLVNTIEYYFKKLPIVCFVLSSILFFLCTNYELFLFSLLVYPRDNCNKSFHNIFY
jgi:hypothetical protein